GRVSRRRRRRRGLPSGHGETPPPPIRPRPWQWDSSRRPVCRGGEGPTDEIADGRAGDSGRPPKLRHERARLDFEEHGGIAAGFESDHVRTQSGGGGDAERA
ncbi:MAG: hypothetical protein ACK6CT_05025, partial [Planctomycetia bacterium]